jgi:hypothetical protein
MVNSLFAVTNPFPKSTLIVPGPAKEFIKKLTSTVSVPVPENTIGVFVNPTAFKVPSLI